MGRGGCKRGGDCKRGGGVPLFGWGSHFRTFAKGKKNLVPILCGISGGRRCQSEPVLHEFCPQPQACQPDMANATSPSALVREPASPRATGAPTPRRPRWTAVILSCGAQHSNSGARRSRAGAITVAVSSSVPCRVILPVAHTRLDARFLGPPSIPARGHRRRSAAKRPRHPMLTAVRVCQMPNAPPPQVASPVCSVPIVTPPPPCLSYAKVRNSPPPPPACISYANVPN